MTSHYLIRKLFYLAAQPIIKPYITKLTNLITGLQDQIFNITRERDALQAKNEKHEATIQTLKTRATQLQEQVAKTGADLKRQRSEITTLQDAGSRSSNSRGDDESRPVVKRIKLVERSDWTNPDIIPTLIIHNINFQMPQRRKLTLEILPVGEVAGDYCGGFRALRADGMPDFGIDWKDVIDVFCLPVPLKASMSWNIVIMPNSTASDENRPTPEPMLWCIREMTKKDLDAGKSAQPGGWIDEINEHLALAHPSKRVIVPDPDLFVSKVERPITKGEPPVWVRAFKRSLEGAFHVDDHSATGKTILATILIFP